ncbi:MAG: serine/threonine protein kinase [Sandaracinaceae bacterium]|nr:serine/threonine protein kinase [Sandaracinaceae bacterium]
MVCSRTSFGFLPTRGPGLPVKDAYIGTEIAGQFRIVSRIGSGGMGAVYKAEQPEMNRHVAIKILHPKYVSRPDLVARFRREARAMSHLSHPNTARVFLYGQLEDGACYIVMEFMEGLNIAQLVRAEGPMETTRACGIMIQVLGALDEAHRAGIIHRDLKPENIFITSQGGIVDFPKVLDFGLAKVSQREMRPGSLILTQEGMVFGTPEFMSPEQAQGKVLDGRSDIYSLGVILFEMLTGTLPFDAKHPMDFISLHITAEPLKITDRQPNRVFPNGLQDAVRKALGKKPEDRYSSTAEFAVALRSVIQGQGFAPGQGVTGAMRAVPREAMVDQGLASARPKKPASGPPPEDVPGVNPSASRTPYIVLGIAVVFAVLGAAALTFAILKS